MLDFPRWKSLLTIVIILSAFCIVGFDVYTKYSYNNQPHKLGVKLGLDLRGGSYLVLQIDEDSLKRDYLQNIYESSMSTLNNSQIAYSYFRKSNDSVSFNISDVTQYSNFKKSITSVQKGVDVSLDDKNLVTVKITNNSYNSQLSDIVDNSIEIVRKRIDSTGTAESSIKRQGSNQIVVELPGVDNPSQIKRLLGTTAVLTFNVVDTDASFRGTALKSGYKYVQAKDKDTVQYAVKISPLIYGKSITSASLQFQENKPVVQFAFNSDGSRKFADFTSKNIGSFLAIVLDNKVISAPRISSAITGGTGIIQGNFSVDEATDLAILLKAGSLPVPLNVVQEKTVGPTLGLDSIKSGIYSCLLGYILVVLYMMIFYKKLGIVASCALVINVVLLVALLSLVGATLTLPGIAGIVLTMGMAVDANILVYERFAKDYSLHTSNFASAISSSFSRVFLTIFDSNITTLLVAIILFAFGSGPVKGFAVTLIIGIITSMFSILFVSKFLINVFLIEKRKRRYKRV